MEITAFAPPAEAHARVAYALTEVRKYLIPDSNDEIRQEQMREMEILAANGGDSISLAAAMAAAVAANDPLKRAAAAAAATLPLPAAAATATRAATCPIQQQAAVLRAGLVRMPPQAAAGSGSQFLAATGAPLISRAPAVTATTTTNGVTVAQQQKLYNEELLLEAAAVSQAPVELGGANCKESGAAAAGARWV